MIKGVNDLFLDLIPSNLLSFNWISDGASFTGPVATNSQVGLVMREARLIKYQGGWIAYVSRTDGLSAPFSINQMLTDEAAEAINQQALLDRIQSVLGLILAPVVLDEEVLSEVQASAFQS